MNAETRITPRAVVFDLDGTLVDSRIAVIDAVAAGILEVAEARGIEDIAIDPDRLRSALGKPAPEYFQSILPAKLRDAWREVKDAATAHEVAAFAAGDGRLYDGVLVALQALRARGILLAVVSNAQAPYFHAALEYGGIGPLLHHHECHEELPEGTQPPYKRALLARALEALQVEAREAVMVGDRFEDLQAGRDLGCRTIAIPFGFGEAHEFAGADAVLEAFSALPDLVHRL